MVKDIIFGGFSAQPDDYLCPDGELSAAANTIPENGALKTILPSKAVMSLPTGCKFLFIHKGIGYEHYIILWEQPSQKAIYWMDSDSDFMTDAYHLIGYFDTLSHVNAVGNTLIIFDDNGMNYFLWQTGNYSALGNQIPFPEISFGLKGRTFTNHQLYPDDPIRMSFDGATFPNTEEEKTAFKDRIFGFINKVINEKCTKENIFHLPFFVRYALRLYDGSLYMPSAPVLMIPSSKGATVFCTKRQGSNPLFDIVFVRAYLNAKVVGNDNWENTPNSVLNLLVNKWNDIVKSVDIFVSPPIYPYREDENIDPECEWENDMGYFVGSLNGNYSRDFTISNDGIVDIDSVNAATDWSLSPYCAFKLSEVYNLWDGYANEIWWYKLPYLSDEEFRKRIEETSRFYLAKSLSLSELCDFVTNEIVNGISQRRRIAFDHGALSALETKELLTDDSLSHDKLIPKQSYTYNNRLNITQIKRELYKGFCPDCLFAYTEYKNITTWYRNGCLKFNTPSDSSVGMRIEVFIKEKGEIFKVSNDSYLNMASFLSSSINEGLGHDCFVFYPNPNAFMMRVTDKGSSNTITFPLKQHDFLNGACAIFPLGSVRHESTGTAPTVTNNSNLVEMPNTIKTSEVNNPFYFPSVGTNTIGTGNVLALCAAVKALSQGQFGQFPMYAFSTEGVWAMQLNSHGGFDAIQPVTRDVCINADSITQLDNAVLFAADRGIMLLSGSQTTCISDNLDATTQFNPIAELPHGGHLAELAGLTEDDLHLLPFKEFIKDCRMIYDYTNQRIVVYNTAKENGEKLCKYAYVYSLKTKSWGMMQTTIVDNVNSYPEALALDETNNVLDLSQPDSLHNANGFIVTRPFKLDYDILKTIRSLIVRGVFARGHVKTALYGSNDLLNWFIVSSSTNHIIRNYSGTPYKYFRLVLLTTMNENESAVGFTVEYVQKQTNQIR